MRNAKSTGRTPANPLAIVVAVIWMMMIAPGYIAGARQEPGVLTGRESRGRDIYFGLATGIEARVGTPPIEAAPMLLACANCHGSDARGKVEAGVAASNITWDALTKPYSVTQPSGRTHPPYTERLLVRAVSLGVDPAGNRLHAAMPRFAMSHADLVSLTQYLKRLSTVSPSGISDAEIRLGTVLPADGPLAGAAEAAHTALTAYFSELNAQGGLYGRRLDLRVVRIGASAPDAKAVVDGFLARETPFALVGGLLTDRDNEVVAVAERRGVPFVGPLTIFPESSGPGRSTFYLLSGVEQQARALVDYAGANTPATTSPPSIAILHATAAVPVDVAGRLREYSERAGWRVTMLSVERDGRDSRAIASELKGTAATHALSLVGGEPLAGIAAAMAAVECHSTLLVPGSLATNDLMRLPQPVSDRLFIALPSLPSDQTPAAIEEYRTLADAHHLSSSHVAWQLTALGSGKVLTQALKNAGRDLTQSTFVTAMEELSDFDSGLMPRLRFGRGRHIGAGGAYIVAVDPVRKEIKQMTGWLRVN